MLEKLDEVIARNSMLDSKFYRAWSKGELPLSAIKEYAKQRYAFEAAFPTYVSAVHARCGNDFLARRILVRNLMSEELWPQDERQNFFMPVSRQTDQMPWHQELWLRFTDALGIPSNEVLSAEPLPETLNLLKTFRTLTNSEDYTVGLAALYAYESQEPMVAKTKRVGLERHYGILGFNALRTFHVHEYADMEHSREERIALEASCLTPKQQAAAAHSAEIASVSWRLFLDIDIWLR